MASDHFFVKQGPFPLKELIKAIGCVDDFSKIKAMFLPFIVCSSVPLYLAFFKLEDNSSKCVISSGNSVQN